MTDDAKKLFDELTAQKKRAWTILLSSHNLMEVQEYCDRVAFIKDGSILAVTDLKNITPRKVVTVSGKDGKQSVFHFEGGSAELLHRWAKSSPQISRW